MCNDKDDDNECFNATLKVLKISGFSERDIGNYKLGTRSFRRIDERIRSIESRVVAAKRCRDSWFSFMFVFLLNGSFLFSRNWEEIQVGKSRTRSSCLFLSSVSWS